MAQNQMNKYVWLVDTIHRAGKISLEDINRKWLDNDLSEGIEIPKRTFHKWRIAIEEMFGLIIENENRGEYRYFILNDDEIQVIADNKDNYFKDQGIENMPDIMAKLIKETLSPDDMTLNKDWLHNEIMEQKMWIQIPVNSIRYHFYQKFTLRVLRQDVFFVCMLGIFSMILIIVPMVFLFINTIRAVSMQRKMIKMIYQDIVTGEWNWLYFQNYGIRILGRHKNRKNSSKVSLFLA